MMPGLLPGWYRCDWPAERDKLAAVMEILVRTLRRPGALDIEAVQANLSNYPALLRRLLTADRFPALAAAVAAGVFDQEDDNPQAEFRSGLRQLLDGIAAAIRGDLLGA
jgi:hypothetical protein